jgi:hypothetical protein
MGKGHGNDGGSTATKRYLLKTKAPEHQQKQRGDVGEDVAAARLATCALSGEPLRSPLVCDELGHLFNKEAVLGHILEARGAGGGGGAAGVAAPGAAPPAFAHLRSIKKDVVAVKVTRASAGASGGSGSASGAGGSTAASSTSSSTTPAPFVCPVTLLEANGAYPFVVMRGCGCMVSERALRAMTGVGAGSSGGGAGAGAGTGAASASASAAAAGAAGRDKCPACDAPFADGPPGYAVIKLCPSDDELALVQQRLAERKRKEKEGAAASASASAAGAAGAGVKRKRQGAEEEEEERAVGASSSSSSGAARSAAAEVDALVAAQRAKSEVYAKLFTSSSSNGAGGKAELTKAEDLFIRTATSVFAQKR